MGWIHDRFMKTGSGIGGRKGKHKGPLRRIVEIKLSGQTMFEPDYVTFECGHDGNSYGGVRGRCRKCGDGDSKYRDVTQDRFAVPDRVMVIR